MKLLFSRGKSAYPKQSSRDVCHQEGLSIHYFNWANEQRSYRMKILPSCKTIPENDTWNIPSEEPDEWCCDGCYTEVVAHKDDG